MKFQNRGKYGSKVMIGTKKLDNFLQRGITQETGITMTRKLFFTRNP